ncbi:MAG TPA: xanthine dehydrogenase family protein molybdopterin-binding subunit, partial [Anaerolineae bacterium]
MTRNEDPRLLTGRALFVDDVDLPGMLHVAFLRSIHARARIRRIDVSIAKQRAGVVAVYVAADLGDYWKPGPLLVQPPPVKQLLAFNERTQVPLAKDEVRHVGEPVVMVVAESRYIAEDALDDIDIDYEVLPVASDMHVAMAPDAPLVHSDLSSNVAAHVIQEKGSVDAVWRDAALVVGRQFKYDHGTAAPIETRGIV